MRSRAAQPRRSARRAVAAHSTPMRAWTATLDSVHASGMRPPSGALDSGTTIHAVTERVVQAGGIPTTVVLHYKPEKSKVPGEPDLYAVTTNRWVVYPFKAGG